ncbi:MAG: MBL fold metallo-hydrolase [Candidatus Vogelbacteria bacterium]|nr:MBL fold metallo-hydrolase [Candidatus Vogelbacteria bacterium]
MTRKGLFVHPKTIADMAIFWYNVPIMIISRFGVAFIKVQQGDTIFAFNPVSREHDGKAVKFGADVALISLNDPRFNGVDNVSFGSKEPFVIDSPGEYEIGGTFVRGFQTEGSEGKINTAFATMIDGIRLCHLGGLANPVLSAGVIEEIGEVDILFLPIGGGKFLTSKDALKLATQLEAKIIIPVLYENGELKSFLKEAGEENIAAIDKLSLKKKDLEGKEGEIIIIQS